jgi:SAM-dependent methyltransferase
MAANKQQLEAWNGGESVHYVDHADRYDRQLEPFTVALLARAQLERHQSVLDVGCGCGATTLAAAGQVERVVGLDLSAPLVEIARSRALAASIDNVEFVIADAQTHRIADGGFDRIISQFGVMFFDDPDVAFANLRRALAPGGTMAFVCWQGLEANEWLMVLGRAVSRYAPLPDLGGRAGGPGMFGLRDPDETSTLLRSAGFAQVECEPLERSILLGGGGSLDDSVGFLLGMGMARGLLGLAGPSAHDAVIESVRADLEARYEPTSGIRVGASAWLVSASV